MADGKAEKGKKLIDLSQEQLLSMLLSALLLGVSLGIVYDVTHTFNEVYNIDLNDTSSLKSVIGSKDEFAQVKNGRIGANFSLEIFLMVLKENKIRKSLINNSFVELM